MSNLAIAIRSNLPLRILQALPCEPPGILPREVSKKVRGWCQKTVRRSLNLLEAEGKIGSTGQNTAKRYYRIPSWEVIGLYRGGTEKVLLNTRNEQEAFDFALAVDMRPFDDVFVRCL